LARWASPARSSLSPRAAAVSVAHACAERRACGVGSELLGVGAGAIALTVDYLKTRKQFGQPIGAFQALQHRAAHLYSEMEIARSAALKAQQLLDAGDPEAERAKALAKQGSAVANDNSPQRSLRRTA
jgi:alkylation response protein AidB-like acyl-CoA dehydrogenase